MSGINMKLHAPVLIRLLLLTLVSSSPVIAADKEAGKTLLSRGDVVSKRTTGNVTLKRRSVIFEKDEIHVGSGGRAQFRMIDKALISLQENSVLQIKNYQYKEGANTNSALLELLSGGLRTITGAIGKGNKKAYELRTPLATIGIRGTDYEVEIVSNGMYVAVWDGLIHLQSRLKNGCNMLIGRSQPFIFIDRLGKCQSLPQVPDVFDSGHSSNVSPPVPSVPVFGFKAFTINQSKPSQEIGSRSTAIGAPEPTFKVGLNNLNNVDGGLVTDFQQSVGGFPVSWGYWGEFTTSDGKSSVSSEDSALDGLIWASYESSDPSIVGARTGTFSRYGTITDSLLSGSSAVSNLQVQMDMNFESGNVTNGALSANTTNDTWVAVFDGQISEGDLDLQLNGASVIDSDPSTSSPVRDASGFIAGDFVGNNAEAIIGAFGLSEDGNTSNHIEGVFIVEDPQAVNQ